MGSKACKHCNSEKHLNQFRPQYTRVDGSILYKATCRACESLRWVGDKENKRKKDRENMALKRANPKTAAIIKARCDAYQKKLSDQSRSTWHERNTGKTCAIHWHTCECCGDRRMYKGFDSKRERLFCKSCAIKKVASLNVGRKCKKVKRLCVDCSSVIEGTAAKKRCKLCGVKKARRDRRQNMTKQRTDRNIRQRAIKHGVMYEPINRIKVYERDGWLCYLCGVELIKSQVYAPNQATIDHVIPMVKGGTHTYANVRACCQQCNSTKGALVLPDVGTAQANRGYASTP